MGNNTISYIGTYSLFVYEFYTRKPNCKSNMHCGTQLNINVTNDQQNSQKHAIIHRGKMSQKQIHFLFYFYNSSYVVYLSLSWFEP
jgi:hypothetical protein